MSAKDRGYFRQRADTEGHCARNAGTREAAKIHAELAVRYRALADTSAPEAGDSPTLAQDQLAQQQQAFAAERPYRFPLLRN